MFDIEGARQEGYSSQEIAEYLAEGSSFDLKGAISEGYSYDEVIKHLGESNLKEKEPTLGSQLKDATGNLVDNAVANTYNTKAPKAEKGFFPRTGEALSRVVSGTGNARGSAKDGLVSGASFGLSDELSGAIGAGLDAVLGGDFKGFPKNYATYRDYERERLAESRESDPDAFLVGEVTSAVLPVGIGAKATKGAYKATDSLMRAKRLPAIWNATKAGATTGGIYGFGQGEGSFIDQAKSTAKGATIGGILSGGLATTGAVLGRIKDKTLKPKGEVQQRLFSRIKQEFDHNPQLDIRDAGHAKTVINNLKVKINSEVDTLIDRAVTNKQLPRSAAKPIKKLIQNKHNSLSSDVAQELKGFIGAEDFKGVQKLIDESNELNALLSGPMTEQAKGIYNAIIGKIPLTGGLHDRLILRTAGSSGAQNPLARIYRGTKKVVPYGQEAKAASRILDKASIEQLKAKATQTAEKQKLKALSSKLSAAMPSTSVPQGGWKGATVSKVPPELKEHVTKPLLDEAIDKVMKQVPKELQEEVSQVLAQNKAPGGEFMGRVTDELTELLKKKAKAAPSDRFRRAGLASKGMRKLTDAKGAPIRDIHAYGAAATRNQAMNKLGYITR